MTEPAVKNSDTRAQILQAASSQFAARGFEGARTQAIADEAGVNKAMLYYHFRDKQHLYLETLSQHITAIFSQVLPIFLQGNLSVRERILSIAAAYHRFLKSNPPVRGLILQELASGGSHMQAVVDRIMELVPGLNVERVFDHIRMMMDSGELRAGDPRQVLLHLLSLTVFPFFARPMLEAIWQITPGEFEELMESRPQAVADLLEHGLLTAKEAS